MNFSTIVTKEDLEDILNFMNSEDCHFVQQMNDYGLDFPAMAFVIDSILKAVNNAKKQLEEVDG